MRQPEHQGLRPVPRPAPAGVLALVAFAALMAACEKRPSDPVIPKTAAAVAAVAEAGIETTRPKDSP